MLHMYGRSCGPAQHGRGKVYEKAARAGRDDCVRARVQQSMVDASGMAAGRRCTAHCPAGVLGSRVPPTLHPACPPLGGSGSCTGSGCWQQMTAPPHRQAPRPCQVRRAAAAAAPPPRCRRCRCCCCCRVPQAHPAWGSSPCRPQDPLQAPHGAAWSPARLAAPALALAAPAAAQQLARGPPC